MNQKQIRGKGLGNKIDPAKVDLTAQLSDELLLNILRRQAISPYPCSLVCKRWLRLHSSLRKSIKLLEWNYLENGRLKDRFPNLRNVDLTGAAVMVPRNPSHILLTHRSYTLPLTPDVVDLFPVEKCIQEHQLSPAALDNGLKLLAEGFPNLQKLSVVDVYREGLTKGMLHFRNLDSVTMVKIPVTGIEPGLAVVARSCFMLQELDILQCTDEALNAISACQNLQIISLTGSFTDVYRGSFTDIGLTILANRFNRLVKLSLVGCEASYHGIAAVGQCCIMLEELTISTRGFQRGWVAAISQCTNLKTLCLESCKYVDLDPGPPEYLGHCPALDCLKLVQCDLRDKLGFSALVNVCRNIRELEFKDCWCLEDDTFNLATKCRKIRKLALEGCSVLTTSGLETGIFAWKELQGLRVTFCDNIRESDISPALADRFASLKVFKWRPDTRSMLAASLAGTGVGQKGGKFFKV